MFIVADSQGQDISHWVIVPVLRVTLMVGPAGLSIYVGLRFWLAGGFPELGFGAGG
jgi:hypothetical protein